jgi:hypothetical protein
MAHGCGLTSVRGNRGENYDKGTAGSPKTYKEKNNAVPYIVVAMMRIYMIYKCLS